jgi:homoserine O-acetyltransferase
MTPDADEALFDENARLSKLGMPETANVGDIHVASGGVVPNAQIAYQIFGEPKPDNIILICHALTGTSNVAAWWDRLVGPGLGIDTRKWCVIGNNLLGGCNGSTGPASLAEDGRPHGSRFPILTIADQVEAQRRLLVHLGIDRVRAVVGCSTGGFHALQWAVDRPLTVEKVIISASGPRQNARQLALNEAARQAVMRDPKWRGGDYSADDPPADGLAVARMIGHIAYLDGAALESKFGRRPQGESVSFSFSSQFAVESYLNYQGDRFVDRFDANSFLHLTRAANFFDLCSLEGASSDFLFLSFSSDTLFPPSNSEELHRMALAARRRSEHVEIDLPFGHDAFLLDGEQQGAAISRFLHT